MLRSLRQLLFGVAVLSLIALTTIAVIFWTASVVSDLLGFRRAEFPPEASLGKAVCSGWSPGLREGSWITIYRLDAGPTDRLSAAGLALLNGSAPPPAGKRRVWSPWMAAGTGADLLGSEDHGQTGEFASRSQMFVVQADRYTHTNCAETIKSLDWDGALVRFRYPRKWTVEQCGDSCLVQVLLPASRLAIGATFD